MSIRQCDLSLFPCYFNIYRLIFLIFQRSLSVVSQLNLCINMKDCIKIFVLAIHNFGLTQSRMNLVLYKSTELESYLIRLNCICFTFIYISLLHTIQVVTLKEIVMKTIALWTLDGAVNQFRNSILTADDGLWQQACIQ